MEYFIIVSILIVIIGVYVISYLANEKTEIPEGLEERYQEAQTCSGCASKHKMLVPEEIIIDFKEENSLWQLFMQF